MAGALASNVPCIEVEYRKKRNKATERSKAQVCREKVEESERKKNKEMTQGLCGSVFTIV